MSRSSVPTKQNPTNKPTFTSHVRQSSTGSPKVAPRLFDQPSWIRRVSYEWDWELNQAILHLKGAGEPYAEPEERGWTFPNKYGVISEISRDFLMAGMVYYNAHPFIAREGLKPRIITKYEFDRLGLPSSLAPSFNLDVGEIETYLQTVKDYKEKK